MNHIYRVIFNRQTGTFQAVSEIAKSTQKTSKGKFAKAFKAFLTPISLAISLFFGLNAHAAPTGGQVVAGQAIINQADLSTNINQTSQNAVINWQSFNVANNETVNFNQPNAQATTLNRVIGNERSVIDGAMNASGKVFISNPNGMLIGKNAQINVGALVATTAKIKDQDFMNGLFKFDEATGTITQLGDIKVPKGGVVALIAPIVENKGKITAPQGKVLLASAEKFSITLPDNANFKYTLDQGTLQGLVDNGGAILADGGHIVLTARGTDAVKKSLIKHTGVAQANTVQNNKGVIELLGDLDNSKLEVVGSLKAEAKESGDGGFIETSASQVKIDDNLQISTQAENGKTGTWLIDPNDIIIASDAGVKPDGTPYTKDEISMSGKKISSVSDKSNVHILSTHGKSKGKGDVIIDDEILWVNPAMNPPHTLKLTAQNDIHINKTIEAKGAVKLVLEYGQGTADGGKSDYYLDKNTPLKDRTVKVNLPEGKTFTTKKGSGGETVEFDVIHQMPKIVKNADGEWESKFTARNIAFGKDIDVSHTKNYEGFAGWQLPKDGKYEWGRVAGLGHTVSHLTLHSKKDNQYTGLFQQNWLVNKGGVSALRDIGVVNAQVRSEGERTFTGGLAGIGGDIISNSYATGNVSSQGESAHAGGLVGWGFYISNSYATGDVSSQGESAHVGGLVGSGGNISNSYATGNVSSQGESAHAGGLVGWGRDISNSYATGNVSSQGGRARTGGLVGWGYNISNSYATGDVSSQGEDAPTGGLVGLGIGISNSYANNARISATGKNSNIGGVLGFGSLLSDRYNNNRSASNSFFNQDRHPALNAIGGYDDTVDKSQIVNVTGKSETELKTKSIFEGWDFDNIWYMNEGGMPKLRAFAQTLTVNPTPTPPTAQTTAGVKAPDLQKTYDGKIITSVDDLKKLDGWKDNFDATGLATGDSVDGIFKTGTLTIDETRGDWKGAKDVKKGGYELYPTGTLKDEYQQKYIIEWNKGVLTINPKPVNLIVVGNDTYNSTNTFSVNDKTRFTQDGILEQDVAEIKIGGDVDLVSKDVGERKISDGKKIKIINARENGSKAENYSVNSVSGYWNILPKKVGVIGKKEFDGSESLTASQIDIDQSAIFQSDQDKVKLNKDMKFTLSGKNRSDNLSLVDFDELKLLGDSSQNYQIDKSLSSFKIAPKKIRFVSSGKEKSLLVNGERVYYIAEKVYDGTSKVKTNDDGNLEISYELGKDDYPLSSFNAVGVTFDANYEKSDVGDLIPIKISNIQLTNNELGNYEFDYENPFSNNFKKIMKGNIKHRDLQIYGYAKKDGDYHSIVTLNESVSPERFKELSFDYDFQIGSSGLLKGDQITGLPALVTKGDRQYVLDVGTLKAPNSNYRLEFQPLHLKLVGNYTPSEYDSRVLAMASPVVVDNKKQDMPDLGLDALSFIDANLNPVAMAQIIGRHQLESVATFFDNTSRSAVSDFIREIERHNISSDGIDFKNPNALLNHVDSTVKELWEIEGAHSGNILRIDGLRKASGTIKESLDTFDKIGLAREIFDNVAEFSDTVLGGIFDGDWKQGVADASSDLANKSFYVSVSRDFASDFVHHKKQMKKFYQELKAFKQLPNQNIKSYLKILENAAPPSVKSSLIQVVKDRYRENENIADVISIVTSHIEFIETSASIFEYKEQQQEITKFLATSMDRKDIARVIVQQKIVNDLIQKGDITPEQLVNMKFIQVRDGKLVRDFISKDFR